MSSTKVCARKTQLSIPLTSRQRRLSATWGNALLRTDDEPYSPTFAALSTIWWDSAGGYSLPNQTQVTTNVGLSTCPDKATLLTFLPFFADAPDLATRFSCCKVSLIIMSFEFFSNGQSSGLSIFSRRRRSDNNQTSQPNLVLWCEKVTCWLAYLYICLCQTSCQPSLWLLA